MSQPDDFADMRQRLATDFYRSHDPDYAIAALTALLTAYDARGREIKKGVESYNVQVRLNALDQELIVYLKAENERLQAFASGSKSADE